MDTPFFMIEAKPVGLAFDQEMQWQLVSPEKLKELGKAKIPANFELSEICRGIHLWSLAFLKQSKVL